MKTSISGNGVKVAKVVKEMQDFISKPGKYSEKRKAIWDIEIDGRPGKEDAKALREKYLHKFDFFTERNINGRCPRGIEQYGHRVEYGILKLKKSWEQRFSDYINKLYRDTHYSLKKGLNTHNISRNRANEVRAFHLSEIERLRPESQHLFKRDAAKISEYQEYLKNNFPYREASGKWAGGDTIVKVYVADGILREGTGFSEMVWSKNGKWSGLDAYYTFYINADDVLVVIGDLATVFKKSDEKETVKACTWWEQGRGFDLVEKTGFLVGGYHSEAKTKELAIKGAKQSKHYILTKDNFLLSIDFVHNKFGFCVAGIRNFMAQNNIESEKITVAELRNIVVSNRGLNCKKYRIHLMKMGINLNCK